MLDPRIKRVNHLLCHLLAYVIVLHHVASRRPVFLFNRESHLPDSFPYSIRHLLKHNPYFIQRFCGAASKRYDRAAGKEQ